jgi:hypothetical protein
VAVQRQGVGDDHAIVDREELVEVRSIDARVLLAVLEPTREVAGLVGGRPVRVVDKVVRVGRLDQVEIEVPITHLEGEIPDEFDRVHARPLVRRRKTANLPAHVRTPIERSRTASQSASGGSQRKPEVPVGTDHVRGVRHGAESTVHSQRRIGEGLHARAGRGRAAGSGRLEQTTVIQRGRGGGDPRTFSGQESRHRGSCAPR